MTPSHPTRPRTEVVDARFREALAGMRPAPRVDPDLDLPLPGGGPSGLSGRTALSLFEAQATSRWLDVVARELRARGQGFYTIGSSGHEGNAVLGELLRPTDLALLHYRSGALFVRRLQRAEGEDPVRDVLLSLCASSEDPVSGGRHKVWGSKRLSTPPQTSTIASHLPKAMGAAFMLERARRLGIETGHDADAIVMCSFGDASFQHSTALGAMNAARFASSERLPVPVLWVCEDNGLGISVPTPKTWVAGEAARRFPGAYFEADGTDLAQCFDAARRAVERVRARREPAFLHMRCPRLFAHAGSDVETTYRTLAEIEADEARDPVLATARTLALAGVATPGDLLDRYDRIGADVRAASLRAERRPRLGTAAEVVEPLAPFHAAAVLDEARRPAGPEARARAFAGKLPEEDPRPRTLAVRINQALREAMAKYPEVLVFGEDVGRKGGVYAVTSELQATFGRLRCFDTVLDEQTILGLAQGAGLLGLLPVPEIQFLAYVHHALDQLRGEACSLQFFSRGRFRNPLVLRIASLGYQKGFGGHFHNDTSTTALRDIPGLVVACPSRGDDAVELLRTALALARVDGRVVVFLEPIALYGEKDLYEDGDGLWLAPFPPEGAASEVGEGRVYGPETADLLVVTYGNGVRLSLRAARRLEAEGFHARVLDLRWLAPLAHDLVREHALAAGRVLFVDEGRRSGGASEALVTGLVEGGLGRLPIARVTAQDTYIPLGDAARLVLPSEEEVLAAARNLCARPRPGG